MKVGRITMNFVVTSRGDSTSNALQQRVINDLVAFGLTNDHESPDIVITVGGDGTMLQAFHDYKHILERTCFVGIHTGHLGFYADWMPEDVEKLINHVAKTPFQVVEYPLLEVVVRHYNETKSEKMLALNECTVRTREGSLVCNIDIKGERLETFRGDGLCISTPSGSTAYNKALGGAILHPSLSAMQIAEMASINNRIYRTVGSPLVLPQHHTCLLKPVNEVELQITIDHFSFTHKKVKSIQCRVAEEKVRFARFRPFSFWKRVKESFVGAE
ncbi:MAG TPA: NAD kinase [Bacilli bacterium]|nr:NAD kinase [Bacilli bacterium]